MVDEKITKITNWMVVFSIAFILISSYLFYLHYSDSESFCDLGEGLSCNIVNKSPYSEFPPSSGIPVSLLGILTFIGVIVLLELVRKGKEFKLGRLPIDGRLLSNILVYIMIFNLLFSSYLVYTELILILSVCILCLTLDIFIIIQLILSIKLRGVINE